MHQFAKGRPDKEDETELRGFVRKIKETLKAEKISSAESSMQERKELHVPGKKSYREYNGVPFKPKANRICLHKARRLNKIMLFMASQGMKKVCSGQLYL